MAIDVDRDLEFYPAIDKIMDKFDDLEKKIDLAVSNTKHLVEQFDKVIKDTKKVK